MHWLKKWLSSGSEENRPSKRSYILLIGLIGLLFLIVSNIFGGQADSNEIDPSEEQEVWLNKDQEKQEEGIQSMESFQNALQEELTFALNRMDGISNVEVNLQLEASALKIYEQNTITGYQKTDENDQSGGTRQVEDETIEHQTVLTRENNIEKPLLIQTQSPAVKGVLVIAEGVDQIQNKQMVIEAVSRLLDVSTHRIAVMPKSREEE
ncbi:stage III sporulation protein AG [Halalkalibacillus halophilus]|uniref:stage III sporulation protein AG n=1 Tax=Halalkalibacillus halophilus TaxID=392827 RepID=UPI000428480A|nr:stage III sporulation protein AG [Halalkalibacillus halophilus]